MISAKYADRCPLCRQEGAYQRAGDDTPVPVLEPGRDQTRKGRLRAYVRDDRPGGSRDPPAGCVAVAADQNCCYPMLRRQKGEAVLSLLIRLD